MSLLVFSAKIRKVGAANNFIFHYQIFYFYSKLFQMGLSLSYSGILLDGNTRVAKRQKRTRLIDQTIRVTYSLYYTLSMLTPFYNPYNSPLIIIQAFQLSHGFYQLLFTLYFWHIFYPKGQSPHFVIMFHVYFWILVWNCLKAALATDCPGCVPLDTYSFQKVIQIDFIDSYLINNSLCLYFLTQTTI